MEVRGFPLPFHVFVRIAFCLRFCVIRHRGHGRRVGQDESRGLKSPTSLRSRGFGLHEKVNYPPKLMTITTNASCH
jgi:hypothetical protein